MSEEFQYAGDGDGTDVRDPRLPAGMSETDNGDYDPYANRKVAKPTTDAQTLAHLLKGCLGTGILAMSGAFRHAGWVVGLIGTLIAGFISTYSVHILVASQYDLCKRKRVPSLTYPQIAEAAFAVGPLPMRKYSRLIYHLSNAFMLMCVLGTCSIYTIFIAANVQAISDYYLGYEVDIRVYVLIILLPLILINLIRNLKLLAPFSLFANVITIISFCIIGYYIFRDPIPLEEARMVGPLDEFPLFFGTVLFALEAIPFIVPLENEMKTPKSFGKPFGVLNKAMVITTLLYAALGMLGYFKYGNAVEASLTLNLPADEWPAQAAKGMLCFGIFISHSLAGYVAFDITWTDYISDSIKNHPNKTLFHYLGRTCGVLVTFSLAIAVPNLDLFISLFGALCLSTLGFILPAIVECATYWDHTRGGSRLTMLLKDASLVLVGLFGLIVGTSISMAGIIRTFTK